ncbi:hypothetical protein B0T17DRAFT_493162 [Bombardia bombarda]|uniref:Nitronate monooxygenase domain-containing protein n=1 Tax=Bombardia bombarda TaxID=252184 RepID=A0AA39X0C0_9PEZI|nr:hypothetical protein B0T17DRAFT_493162 [Bombardia bombarda]
MSWQQHLTQSVRLRKGLAATYSWIKLPLIIGAPMRVMSGPELAVAISLAGGIGFIGPGETPDSTAVDLEAARAILEPQSDNGVLPIGVGFQLWNGSLSSAVAAVSRHRPAAAWLFAPRDGQADINEWTTQLRAAQPIQIWLQVGTLAEALSAAESSSPPDVLVIQGAEAGGHGRAIDGTGFITLLPEVADALRSRYPNTNIALLAAGGIADGRGVAAALSLGAAGAVMGTRFLASKEARIKKGYQDEVVRATDGGGNTVRTQLYNHLRGTYGWPKEWSPRTVVNRSWNEEREGVAFDELRTRHDELVKQGGGKAWGPDGRTATYAGAGVGLVKSVDAAGDIVMGARAEAVDILKALHCVTWSEDCTGNEF